MPEQAAHWIVNLASAYAVAGGVFSIFFSALGAGRIDPAARGATLGFRLLLLPGAAALWPYLAWRWLRGAAGPPEEKNAHRSAAGGPP